MSTDAIFHAAWVLGQGGIIAYPTEAFFCFFCDPLNSDAVYQLLRLKRRSPSKGLILIADSYAKLQPFLAEIPPEKLAKVLSTWPGPYTWIFPANLTQVPEWIRGIHQTVAVRVTAHPLSRKLCQSFGSPVVSTSANFEGSEPLRTAEGVEAYFGNAINYILPGETGESANPTEIRDALTEEVLREG